MRTGWVRAGLISTIGLLLASGLPPAAVADISGTCDGAPRAPYVDVDDRDTHADAVACLHGLRIVLGRQVDAFDPSATLRRDQMASLIARTLEAAGVELPTGDRHRFPDAAGGPHAAAIASLAELGIVQGRADGRYHPSVAVPRGQMTAFVVRAHDHLLEVTSEGRLEDHRFDDARGHPHEATIARAAHLRLAAGRTTTTFDPDGPTRRDQTATFLARVLEAARAGGVTGAPTWEHRTRTSTLPATLRRTMTGSSWRSGCPVGLDDLRLIETVHRGFDGRDRVGLLVVHRSHVDAVVRALTRAYHDGFRIERMRLVDRFGADDARSMAANNTHAFNCRTVAGSDRWSEHAYGRAIDVNPVQNPYVRGSTVEPSAGRAYLDRSDVRTGMAVEGGPLVRAFDAVGWGWGGRWSSSADHQHFSSTGR